MHDPAGPRGDPHGEHMQQIGFGYDPLIFSPCHSSGPLPADGHMETTMGRATDGLTEAEFKARAHRLREALEGEGMLKLGHSRALEVLSRVHGYANWHAAQADLRRTPTPVALEVDDDSPMGRIRALLANVKLDTIAPDYEGAIWTVGIQHLVDGFEFKLGTGSLGMAVELELPATTFGMFSVLDLANRMGAARDPKFLHMLQPILEELARSPFTEGMSTKAWREVVAKEGLGASWDFLVYPTVHLRNEAWSTPGIPGFWFLSTEAGEDRYRIDFSDNPARIFEVMREARRDGGDYGPDNSVMTALIPAMRGLMHDMD